MVGAEISGPALPRFTSGVAAAWLVKEAALHEQHLDSDAQNSSDRHSIRLRGSAADHLILAAQGASRLHNCYLGPPRKLPATARGSFLVRMSYQTARQRNCALAKQ